MSCIRAQYNIAEQQWQGTAVDTSGPWLYHTPRKLQLGRTRESSCRKLGPGDFVITWKVVRMESRLALMAIDIIGLGSGWIAGMPIPQTARVCRQSSGKDLMAKSTIHEYTSKREIALN